MTPPQPNPAGTPPAPLTLSQALATPPQAPVTLPHALATQQPAPAAPAATPPARGLAMGGPGVDRPAGRPDEASTGTDDTGVVRVGQPATDGLPAAPAGEAPARVAGAPVVSVPAATAPGAATPQLAQPTLLAQVAGASTTSPADTATSGRVPDVAIDAPPGSPQFGPQLGQATVFHQAGAGGDGAARQQAQGSGAPWAPAGDGGLAFDDGLAAPPARAIGRGLVDAYA